MNNSSENKFIDQNIIEVNTHAQMLSVVTGTSPMLILVLVDETYNGFQVVWGYDGLGNFTRLQAKGVVPQSPTNLMAGVGVANQAALSWVAPTIVGTNALINYLVEYKLSSSGTWLTFSHSPSTATSINVTGLTNGVSYDFRVSAINNEGTSLPSNIASVVPSQLPGTPTGLTATDADNAQSTLSWTAPAAGGNPITDYFIEYKLDTSGTWLSFSHTPSASTTITVTGLTNESMYDFRVSATNSNGTGAPSNVTNGTPEQFDLFISAVSGNDANNGTTPLLAVATPSRIQTLALAFGNNVRIKFLEASVYRDHILLPNLTGVIIYGNYSTLNCADIPPASWTQPDSVNYPNVWSQTINVQDHVEQGASMTVDNLEPLFVSTSISDCNATSFSYYVPASYLASTSGPSAFPLYVNTGTNPNTDGKLYEVMSRQYGIDLNNSATVRALICKTETGNNGSGHILESMLVQKSMFCFGTKHNVYGRSGIMQDVITFGCDGFAAGPGPFVFNSNATVPTYNATFSRCIYTYPYDKGFQASAFYSHNSGAIQFLSITLDGSIVNNILFFGSPSTEVYNVSNSYGHTVGGPAGVSGENTVINTTRFLMNQSANTGSCIIHQTTGTQTITDSAYYVGITTQGTQIINIVGTVGDLVLQNIAIDGGNRTGMNNQTTSTANLTINKCLFTYQPNFRNQIIVTANQTYVGDYNVFYNNSTSRPVQLSYKGTSYSSLALWQAASGQDAHSVYLTPIQKANFYLGTTSNGDFRINPNAQVTAANGTVYTGTFPDGTPLSAAGPQTRYNFNTRLVESGTWKGFPNVPLSYNDCITYIGNPLVWPF